jgi:uncharacterized membrane protein
MAAWLNASGHRAPSAEPTIAFLGIIVPDESPLFLAIVAGHIVLALATVIVGVVAMLAAKRVGRHSQFGKAYYWLMLTVFLTATALATMRWSHSWHLFILGVLAFATTALGRFVLRSRHHARFAIHLWAMGVSYILLLTAFYVDNGKNLPIWKDLSSVTYWTLPALVGIPIIIRTMLRHPLLRRRAVPH